MTRIKILLAAFAVLLSVLACATVMGGGDQVLSAQVTGGAWAESLQQTQSCPIITNQIMAVNSSSNTAGEADDNTSYAGRNDDNETYIITYPVTDGELGQAYDEQIPANLQSERNDTAAHIQIWDYFAGLFPYEQRKMVTQFSIMTDGPDNVLASVAQISTDAREWTLDVDIADAQDYYYLTFTLVHEFAHLLTLNADQVPPDQAVFNNPDDNNIYLQAVSACPNYFPGEGCAKPDSYINEFYNHFWTNIYSEWNDINLEENDDVYYQRLEDFYLKYQDQFVTDYAVTNPAEDIAESFAFFVFSPQPPGNTIAEQKMLFFYQYPELVQLRTKILNHICTLFPQ